MVGVYLYRIISEHPRPEGRSEGSENKVKRCGASLFSQPFFLARRVPPRHYLQRKERNAKSRIRYHPKHYYHPAMRGSYSIKAVLPTGRQN
jgi:hypothetical protein